MQKKPVGGYQWCTEVSLGQSLATTWDSGLNYIVEVNLAYPAAYHKNHNDPPSALERKKNPAERRSDYATS